jgi:phosphate transport system permease protein
MTSLLDRPTDATRKEVERALSGSGRDGWGLVFQAALLFALLVTMALLLWLLYAIVDGAIPVFQERGVGDFLSGKLSGSPSRFGVSQGIQGSLWIVGMVAVIAFPVGVASAVYLEEYASNSWFANLVNVQVRNLAGVPAVV